MESKLTNIKFSETTSLTKISKLINYIKDNKESIGDEEETRKLVMKLSKIKHNIKDGNFSTTYFRKINYGRIYPKYGLSLGTIYRPFRHYLLEEYYNDVDMENAQPTILYEYCLKENIPCYHLKQYVINRDKFLESIMNHFECERDIAKNLFIRIMNNGSYKAWKKEFSLESYIDLPIINELSKEFSSIRTALINKNKTILSIIPKKDKEENIEGSFMSYFLGEKEHELLECMVLYYIEKFKSYNVILCHDGFMIPKIKDIDEFCLELQSYIKKQLGYSHIRIKNKLMNESINIPNDVSSETSSITDQPNTDELFESLMNYNQQIIALEFYEANKDCFKFYEDKWYAINQYNVWKSYSKECQPLTIKVSEFLNQKYQYLKQCIELVNDFEKHEELTKLLSTFIKTNGSAYSLSGIITFLRAYYYDDTKNLFDSKPHLFALNNKVLVLEEETYFRDIQPNDYISLTTGYDYEEEDETIGNIYYDALKKIFPSQDLLFYKMEVIARAMFGKSPEKIYFEIGDGGNGKSLLFTSWCESAFGEYFTVLNKSILTKPMMIGGCPELVSIRNKRLIVVSETSFGDIFNTGVLNSLTGGETITARDLYSSITSFECIGSLSILSNYKPKFDAPIMSNLTRRMEVTPYNSRFVSNDDDVDIACHIYKASEEIKSKEFIMKNRCQFLHLLTTFYNPVIKLPKVIRHATDDYFKSNSGTFVEWFNENYKQTYKGPINLDKQKELFDNDEYVSISNIYDIFKQSETYRLLDRNEKKNHTMNYCKDCLVKTLYTKYYVETYQKRIDGIKKLTRNILLGFKLNQKEEEDSKEEICEFDLGGQSKIKNIQ